MDERDRTREMLNDATSMMLAATAAAAGAAVTGASGGTALAVAAIGAAQPGLAMFVKIAAKWKEREAHQWWYNVLYGNGRDDGATPEKIAGIIDKNQEEPFVRETIMRSLRTLYDTPDPCAVLPLALLAREYIREGKAPDYRFRGLCDLLIASSRSEFDLLQQFVAKAAKLPRTVLGYVGISLLPAKGYAKPEEHYILFTNGDGVQATLRDPGVARLVRKLVRSELVEEVTPTSAEALEGGVDMRIGTDMLAWLVRILLGGIGQ
jgi:hypothetical protein